jgi:hypothetical protein
VSDEKKTKLETKLELLSHCKGNVGTLRSRIRDLEASIARQTSLLRETRAELIREQRCALDLANEIAPLLHAEVAGFVGKIGEAAE